MRVMRAEACVKEMYTLVIYFYLLLLLLISVHMPNLERIQTHTIGKHPENRRLTSEE
jgi:hypothetical protein